MRPYVRLGALLATILVAGALLERTDRIGSGRDRLRGLTVPGRALDDGALGRLLRRERLVYSTDVEQDGSVRRVWRVETGSMAWPDGEGPRRPVELPPWPTISVVVGEDDLSDPERGLLPNWERSLERPAHVTWFEEDELRFASRCGIRLHGGTSRDPEVMERRGLTWRSYRLYLREEYGEPAFPPDLLGPDAAEPIDRLVVRGNSALRCALAFDLSRRCGAGAPAMRPGIFLLNGKLQGLFSLAEHLTRRTWARRLGHDDFRFHRDRGNNDEDDAAAHAELEAWAAGLGEGEVTRERVGERVDVDQLARHLFVIGWCGVHDWAQGAAVLDETEESPRWRWVHWDLDNAFQRGLHPELPAWEKPFLELIDDRPRDVRSRLFTGLLRDDPGFRADFLALVIELMNHRLSRGFLEERLRAYAPFVGDGGIPRTEFKRTQTFFLQRSRHVREELRRTFRVGEPHRCEVRAPDDVSLRVDGHQIEGPYAGWYFPGQELVVEGASSWTVDGQPVETERLVVTVDGPRTILAR